MIKRHWVTFETPVVEMDSDGATEEVWIPAFYLNHRMPCEVKDLSGRELLAAQAVHSKVTTRIRTQYRPGFDAKMRAIHRDRVYNVEAVIRDPDSQTRYVTLLCSTGVNEG